MTKKKPPGGWMMASNKNLRSRFVMADCLNDRLRNEIKRLQEEQEILVWNLGGCLTYAEGHGLDGGHSMTMARPALNAVLAMAKENRRVRRAKSCRSPGFHNQGPGRQSQ